jgi:hypothetical protein
MNKISKLFSEIPDAELKELVVELKGLSDTGILTGEKIRELTALLSSSFGINTHDARHIAEREILFAAASRWAGLSDEDRRH